MAAARTQDPRPLKETFSAGLIFAAGFLRIAALRARRHNHG